MKYGVIDIGSNSVRLMISDGVRTLYKTNKVTKLGEGVANDAILSSKAINSALPPALICSRRFPWARTISSRFQSAHFC